MRARTDRHGDRTRARDMHNSRAKRALSTSLCASERAAAAKPRPQPPTAAAHNHARSADDWCCHWCRQPPPVPPLPLDVARVLWAERDAPRSDPKTGAGAVPSAACLSCASRPRERAKPRCSCQKADDRAYLRGRTPGTQAQGAAYAARAQQRCTPTQASSTAARAKRRRRERLGAPLPRGRHFPASVSSGGEKPGVIARPKKRQHAHCRSGGCRSRPRGGL